MSNNPESSHLEVVNEEPSLSREQVIDRLIAIGVNNCNRSYDSSHKELKGFFVRLPLCEIANTWDHLEDAVKVSVIDNHSEEFRAWVSGS